MENTDPKFREFFERARKGVVAHLDKKGGMLTLHQLHEYSLNTYLIQHQRFSLLMESLVNEGLVIFNDATQEVVITDKGKAFIQ